MNAIKAITFILAWLTIGFTSGGGELILGSDEPQPISQRVGQHEDYQMLQQLYPRIKQIQPILFSGQRYYALIRYKKIKLIATGWKTNQVGTTLWFFCSPKGQLLELVWLPANKRVNLAERDLFLKQAWLKANGGWPPIILDWQQTLDENWETFIRTIKLNIKKNDATTHATP